jgi:hypothetical protein
MIEEIKTINITRDGSRPQPFPLEALGTCQCRASDPGCGAGADRNVRERCAGLGVARDRSLHQQ